MKQEISLLDMRKNEVGRLMMESGSLKLYVPDTASHLEQDLKRVLELINRAGTFAVRKNVKEDGAILEVEEMVGADHRAYMGAVADFINKSKLRSPRIFAVLRQDLGGDQ